MACLTWAHPSILYGVAVQRKMQQVYISLPLFTCEESQQKCSREEGRERGKEVVSQRARALGMELIPQMLLDPSTGKSWRGSLPDLDCS